jgi:hypothetical protein
MNFGGVVPFVRGLGVIKNSLLLILTTRELTWTPERSFSPLECGENIFKRAVNGLWWSLRAWPQKGMKNGIERDIIHMPRAKKAGHAARSGFGDRRVRLLPQGGKPVKERPIIFSALFASGRRRYMKELYCRCRGMDAHKDMAWCACYRLAGSGAKPVRRT